MKSKYQVIIQTSTQDEPYDFELSASEIIANYFKTDVIFLRPSHLKNPDLKIKGQIWELKSPVGNSKNTIHNIIKTARKQSPNIIIDLRRCKLNERNALARVRETFKRRKRKIGKYLIIDKSGRVIDVLDIL